MTGPPRVSFVVPTYNYVRFVPHAVESLLAQSFRALEVIVIDDASTDGTDETLAAFAGDPRVRLVRHAVNQGHIRTYNEGIGMARGDFVGLLSADDLCLDREAVARQVAVFDADPEVGLVYPAQAYVDDAGRLLGVAAPWDEDHVWDGLDEFGHLVFTNYVPASGPLVRRTCHDALGRYDERLPHAGDWDLWLRICSRYRVGYLAEPLYGYRMHGVNMHHHTVTPRQATGEHVLTVDRAFAAMPSGAPRAVRRLRRPALRQVALSVIDWEKGHGRTGRAWRLALHGLRRSPDLLLARQFYAVLAKLALVTGLGRGRAVRLASFLGRRVGHVA
jgi:glycosyltransferase involved in cell wall biosynthesis